MKSVEELREIPVIQRGEQRGGSDLVLQKSLWPDLKHRILKEAVAL